MILVKDTLISDNVLSDEFACNISKCKGECCVAGEAGAPLEKDEVGYLQKNYSKIKPYLSKKGKKAIEQQGVYVDGLDGDLETPLVNGKECAYAVFSSTGIASCGIENAYRNKSIDFQKPISCHLYPVRINQYNNTTAVNYHKWSICSDACSLGETIKIPVYQFVKNALIRKFGKEWFNALHASVKKTS